MKRAFGMIAVFGLAALMAGYVALAPNASSFSSADVRNVFAALDDAAITLIAIRGRDFAVLGLMGLGLALALLIGFAFRGKVRTEPSAPSAPRRRKRKEPEDEAPGPVWRPEPASEDRIASLRRRAMGESASEPVPSPMPLPRPLVLVRKPRERDRDWFADRSWLGGVPRLGEAEWPRDANGIPLPFAAQVDLGELSAACPESPLPAEGSLAFFLGTGAVVAVPSGAHDFSEPPQDLPPAFDEGGHPFPARTNRLRRYFFPFWPVEPVTLDLPEDCLDHRDASHDEAIEEAMATALSEHASLREYAFTAEVDCLWWHGVNHLADQLHVALEGCGRLVALKRDGVNRAMDVLASLEAEGGPDDDPGIEAARAELSRQQDALAEIEAQCENLPQAIAAIDQFVSGRDPWVPLTLEECGIVEDFLAELHAAYGDLVRYHVPRNSGALATLSLRAMITGAPDALAAMPEDQLARINRDYRLPTRHQHQMFGLGACQQSARDEHRHDILLLQLGYDDMMEWRWGDMGLFQFWISPEDAAAGNWQAVQLTFECA